MRAFNLADLFEIAADAQPDRLALVAGPVRHTYAELDERATRIGNHLRGVGVAPGDHVAVLSWNRAEWVETFLGILKVRAVPINVNYRYAADELAHVLSDAVVVAIVAERAFLPMLDQVRSKVPSLRHLVVIEDGTATSPDDAGRGELVAYETAVSTASPARNDDERSGDDRYVLYTGGTTGAPKGVVWRSEDLFFAALAGGRPGGDPITTPEELVRAMSDQRQPWLVTSPMMHGNGQWNSLSPLLTGQGVVLWTGHRFDAAEVAALAATEGAFLLVLIGDGMALPFVEVLEQDPVAHDLSGLRVIASGGAILSPTLKQRLADLLPHCTIVDGFGASETGSSGRLIGSNAGGPPRFAMSADTAVLDDDLRPTPVGEVGRLARRGHVPLGYWNDDAKTAATFPTDADGTRWAIPGDLARPEDDGTITLLGRGSSCINTGGEKVHPEEVAVALKTHPDITDAIVVGAPDERFGQRVVAVVAPRGGTAPDLDSVRAHLRPLLAGYKAPRQLLLAEALRYTPQGKPDLRWAADLVALELEGDRSRTAPTT